MQSAAQNPVFAWQPFTPRGVGAFAYASTKRLLAVQFIFALLAASTVLWFFHECWFPPILQAIRRLPNEGQIRRGSLGWRAGSPQWLADNRFLSLVVDLNHEGQARSPAHVQVEFGKNDCKVISLFGFVQYSYSKRSMVTFNRPGLEPWWGAWSPAILAIIAVLVIAGLLLSWAFLATLYFLPVWLLGFFANRDLTLRGSWRLAGAALMPGVLLFIAAIFFYGLGMIDPIRLVVAAGLHIVISWIFLLLAAFKLPLHPAVVPVKGNPFVPGADVQPAAPPSSQPSPPASPP